MKSIQIPLLVSVALALASTAGAEDAQKDATALSVSPAQVVRGTFIDKRDGSTYKTVEIGTQIWMAQNLNFKTDSSWCYDDKAENCKKYGRLYTWKAAKSACPDSWHLPTDAEWTVLESAVGGHGAASTNLRSTSGWDSAFDIVETAAGPQLTTGPCKLCKGSDDDGFTVLPAGNRGKDGVFKGVGNFAFFWSATESRAGGALFRSFYGGPVFSSGDQNSKKNGFSVRCMKD